MQSQNEESRGCDGSSTSEIVEGKNDHVRDGNG